MEKTFHRYLSKPSARKAFVEAEAVTYLAHQIRALRAQRGWSQKDLADRMGKTQASVSRLEDPSYGRISFMSMVELAHAFDVAPVLMFKSTIQLMRERWIIDRKKMEVKSFSDEAETIAFIDTTPCTQLCSSSAVVVWDTDLGVLPTTIDTVPKIGFSGERRVKTFATSNR